MECDAPETSYCTNCKRDISATNFVMHEMHCRRHIQLCEHCKEPVPRAEFEQHFNDVHATTPCQRCKENVAKSEMETHMASNCKRRLVSCEFCELSFPHEEFERHVDFCGSRTEPCQLCQQYIMLKDMLRHETSGCTYPAPKPPPVSNPQPDFDPFNMLEMNNMLANDRFHTAEGLPDFAAILRHGFDRDTFSIHRNFEDNTAPPAAAQTRNSRRGNGRRKADVNVQRANNLSSQALGNSKESPAIPPDMDYDAMLALQMAHDDWALENDPDMAIIDKYDTGVDPEPLGEPDWEYFNRETDQTSIQNRPEEDEEEDAIPCEFCEENVSLENYLEHLERCPLSNMRERDNRRSSIDLNNEVLPSSTTTASRPSIPVINNLRADPATVLNPPDFSSDFAEDIMLPCEFCEEMFPSEMIIQHQSVCQSNGMVTPRVLTPAAGRGNNSQRHAAGAAARNKRSSRHGETQPSIDPSLLDYLNDPDISSNSFFNTERQSQRVPQSSSNKYSKPVDRFDEDIARPPRRSSRPSLSEDADGIAVSEQQARRGVHTKRENTSAQRARARLNQLLQDDGDKPRHNSSGASGATNGTKGGRMEKKGNIDSRSVMRQLDATKPKINKNRPHKTSVSSPSSNRPLVSSSGTSSSSNGVSSTSESTATAASTGARSSSSTSEATAASTGARSRQRADHLFNPELRLKPDHNPRASKK